MHKTHTTANSDAVEGLTSDFKQLGNHCSGSEKSI